MRVLVIGNPVSGGGRSRPLVQDLVARLRERGHDARPYLTTGDRGETAHALAEEETVDRLAIVGGDGTVNEVLNGLRDPARIPLAVLSTGTANILGHDLALPRDPKAVARMIDEGRVRRLDMGRVGEHRFLAVVSCGFDALVTRDVHEHRDGTLGYLAYAKPILRSVARYEPPALTVRVDGAEPVAGQLVLVSNMRNYGGLFSMADRARCDSGHLDICVVKQAHIPQLVRVAVAGLTRGLSGQDGVVYLTGRRIELTSAEPYPVQVDGDYHGATPVEIDLTPSHVPFVTPA